MAVTKTTMSIFVLYLIFPKTKSLFQVNIFIFMFTRVFTKILIIFFININKQLKKTAEEGLPPGSG